MTSACHSFLYGRARCETATRLHLGRPLVVGVGVLALFMFRLSLPFGETPAGAVHQAVAWALLAQRNWGKQALVGILEYPPLPTLALLVLTPLTACVRRLFGLAAGPGTEPLPWLVAGAQVWAGCYLYRTGRVLFSHGRSVLVVLPVCLLPLVGHIGAADPYWISIVPATSICFHLCRWERERSLRDLVVVSLNCGVLVLGGVTDALLAVAVIAALWRFSGDPRTRQPGSLTLLAFPLVYTFLLHPLCNWLIMGDALFCLGRFSHFLQAGGTTNAGGGHVLGWLMLAVLLVVAAIWRGAPLVLRVAVVMSGGALVGAAFSGASGLFLGGDFLGCGAVVLLLAVAVVAVLPGTAWARAGGSPAASVAVVLAVACCMPLPLLSRRTSAAVADFLAPQAPPAADPVFALLDNDEHWRGSRILVFDLRTASMYARDHPDRFVASLDFDEARVREMIKPEQFHLLLPPANGQFYPRDSRLQQLHREGAPWLFLERRWESGWQLWRCIRPRPSTSHTSSVGA